MTLKVGHGKPYTVTMNHCMCMSISLLLQKYVKDKNFIYLSGNDFCHIVVKRPEIYDPIFILSGILSPDILVILYQ
jgi:hypothetical protein